MDRRRADLIQQRHQVGRHALHSIVLDGLGLIRQAVAGQLDGYGPVALAKDGHYIAPTLRTAGEAVEQDQWFAGPNFFDVIAQPADIVEAHACSASDASSSLTPWR